MDDQIIVRIDPGATNALARDDAEVVDLFAVSVRFFDHLVQGHLRVIKIVISIVKIVKRRILLSIATAALFDDGRHRFVIAKILNLDTIPVRVFVRNEKWQKFRSEVATAKKRDELSAEAIEHLDYPDIHNVASFTVDGERTSDD